MSLEQVMAIFGKGQWVNWQNCACNLVKLLRNWLWCRMPQ
jgi:hypothetical protein